MCQRVSWFIKKARLYKLKRTLSRHIFYLVIIFTTTANNPKKDSDIFLILFYLFVSKLYIYFACLSLFLFLSNKRQNGYACLSVCFYPINVKTAEPIGTKFCVGPHVVPGKVYE